MTPGAMNTDSLEFAAPMAPADMGQMRILCCQCGVPIAPNAANMCLDCVRSQVDITEGVPKQATLHFCRGCERYLQPPAAWIPAQLESRELLTLCLKKLKGLGKLRLVDAGFVWTEPHSKRVKVKLTVQKEAFRDTILQQVFIVEFVVANQTCEDCHKVAAQNTWKASVQVRQKVGHKRTFFFLEQLILKHNAHRDTVNIKEMRDGIDFFFVNKQHALRLLEFLASVVPVRSKSSEQLISTDIHTSTSNSKTTYSVEIAPICKDDLLCLPPRVARGASAIAPVCVCYRVGTSLLVVDPNTCHTAEIRGATFWEHEFRALREARDLTEFYVIDVTYDHPVVRNGKFTLANVEVCRGGDFATTYVTRTHLGHILRPGDHVLGYDLTHMNANNDEWDALVDRHATNLPDVILVRKSYPHRRRKPRARHWKLGRLAKEAEQGAEARGGSRGDQRARTDADFEMFLRDIEEDVDLRGAINLFKARPAPAAPAGDVEMGGAAASETEPDTFREPTVARARRRQGGDADLKLAQTLIRDQHASAPVLATAASATAAAEARERGWAAVMGDDGQPGASDDEDAATEDDFPEVQLEELLEELSLS